MSATREGGKADARIEGWWKNLTIRVRARKNTSARGSISTTDLVSVVDAGTQTETPRPTRPPQAVTEISSSLPIASPSMTAHVASTPTATATGAPVLSPPTTVVPAVPVPTTTLRPLFASATGIAALAGTPRSLFPFTPASSRCATCGQPKPPTSHRTTAPANSEGKFHFQSGIKFGDWQIDGPSLAEQGKVEATAADLIPLTTFHPFPQLPPELRSKILSYYLERPRIVEIRCVNDLKKIHFSRNALGNMASNVAWRADNTLPALMWVNRECREETKAFYRIRLPLHPTNKIAWPVFINPEWDTVVFTFPWAAEIPMDILLSDCLAFDPFGVGLRHFGTRERCGPSTWDLTPVAGCVPLKISMANLQSYTEVVQLMDDHASARFPVWMIHEGYLTSAIAIGKDFYNYLPYQMPLPPWPNAERIRANLHDLRDQLEGFVPKKALDGLTVQRMYHRKHFRHLDMSCSNTEFSGLGVVRIDELDGHATEFLLSNGRVLPPRKVGLFG